MRAVTREEFFAYMGPRDVHPRPEPDRSVWVDQRTHAVVGISTPGYRATGPASYSLVGAAA